MNSTEREFSDTLYLLTDFNPGKVLVAFSGGCDSVALLALCCRTLGQSEVEAVYVNHRIRTDAELDSEVELNRTTCRTLGVRLTVCDLGYGAVSKAAQERRGGTEDAARFLRYRILQQQAEVLGCKFILTAHHRDDQVETVLMRIVSHSPVTSLRGIKESSGNILRPLLVFSKQQLQEYISELGLKYSTDSTNLEQTYRRNWIRNTILPQLRIIMPDCDRRILAIRDKAVLACGGFEFEGTDCIDLIWFRSLSRERQIIALYACWDHVVGGQLPQTLIDRVIAASSDGMVAANGGCFSIYNGRIYITKEVNVSSDADTQKARALDSEWSLVEDGVWVCLSCCGSPTDLRFPQEVCGSLMVRQACVSDSIRLKDGSKSVFRLLQDQKIPPVRRPLVPVVVLDDEVVGVLAEVVGGRNRICQRFITSLAPSDHYYYINTKSTIKR